MRSPWHPTDPSPMLRVRWHPEPLAVCRLESCAEIPHWFTAAAPRSPIAAVVRTAGELSLVVRDDAIPAEVLTGLGAGAGAGIVAERDFVAAEVIGPLDFALFGVLRRLLGPLADAGIPVLAISTHDTDWLLVRRSAAAAASAALGTVALLENTPPT